MKKIPVTVLTGFLGSGKTTLLNRILSENHGLRIAVIENEFGEIGIDQALVIDADEEVFEMNNGCICCTVRGDLIRILGNLMKRKDKFDRILVETTGMADPGPVAQTFFVDEDMRDLFTLDGIVTLVDTKHLGLHLEDSNECRQQLAFADVLVLNKTDLVDEDELRDVERRVRRVNGLAKVLRATNADVPISEVLGIGGFDLGRALETKPTFLEPEYPFEAVTAFDASEGVVEVRLTTGPDPSIDLLVLPVGSEESAVSDALAERALRLWVKDPRTLASDSDPWEASSERPVRVPTGEPTTRVLRIPRDGRYALFSQHLPEEFSASLVQNERELVPADRREFAAGHTHDEEVTSVGIHLEGALEPERLNTWLSRLLREKGLDIFRMKGILNVAGSANRYVFQGVHMLLDGREDRPWGATPRANDLVFIGRNLDRKELTEGLVACLA